MNRRIVIVLVASVFGAVLSVIGFVGTVAGQVRVSGAMTAFAITAFLLAALISALTFLSQNEQTATV